MEMEDGTTLNGISECFQERGFTCLASVEYSKFKDEQDPLAHLRNEFYFPKVKNITKHQSSSDKDRDVIYLCGNSLGLQSKRSKVMVQHAMESWANLAVEGWFQSYSNVLPWYKLENSASMLNVLENMVGAKPIEIAICSSLTQNLNNLLLTFYKPTPNRHKILVESKMFPSDLYAISKQMEFHGYSQNESLVELIPRIGEDTLRTKDILDVIERLGEGIALVLLPGIQYYTGQLFDIKLITSAAQAKGCKVGWDLAHAIGNVPLKLNEWNVDFAVWCHYKYVNAGPGSIGGLFLHERYAFQKIPKDRFAGWWALDIKDRFKMEEVFEPEPGASGYKQSTVDVLSLFSLFGSLQTFAKTDIESLRKKSIALTSYLECLLRNEIESNYFRIITPSSPDERGCQLSLVFTEINFDSMFQNLLNNGVICDKRNPNCLRISPTPLYCSFDDVRRFVQILKDTLANIK